MTEQLTALISSIGFPIFACIWLATTFKHSLDANTKALESLQSCVESIRTERTARSD